MPTYEIYTRESGEHRPGHLSFKINGEESDVTVDPAQFMPKALLETKGDPKKALAVCERIAKKALERRIDRLRLGSLITGGLPLVAGSLDTSPIPPKKRVTEEEAVASFLNRGRLQGLDKKQRQARMKRRVDRKNDNTKAWHESRAKLIALRTQQLKEVEKEFKETDSPKLQREINSLKAELVALKAPIINASHGFQYAYGQYLTKQVSLSADDIRIVPCMTNTTADTVRDAVDACSDLTLDEFDGANYSTGGLALDSQAVNIDDANDRAEFDAADEVVSALGAGTRSIQGVLLISFITNLGASLPLHWIEFSSNKTPDGSDFTFVFNAEGILQAADG